MLDEVFLIGHPSLNLHTERTLFIIAHLVVAVDPGLDLSVENESHELVLEGGHGRVEAGGHEPEVG